MTNNIGLNKINVNQNKINNNILDGIDDNDEKSIKNSKIPINEIPSYIKKENPKEGINYNFNIDKDAEVSNSINTNQITDEQNNNKLNENLNINNNNNYNNKGNTNITNNFNNNNNINGINTNGNNIMNSKENKTNNQNISQCNNNINNNNNHVLKNQTNKIENDLANNKNNYALNNNNFSNKANTNMGENNNSDNYNNMNYKANYRKTNNFQDSNPTVNNNIINGTNTFNMNINNTKAMVFKAKPNKNNIVTLDDNNQNKNIINNNINNNNKLNVGTANESSNYAKQKSQETNINANTMTKNQSFKDNIQKIPMTITFNKTNFNKIFGNYSSSNIYCPGCKGFVKNGFYCEKCCLDHLIKKIRYSYIEFIKYNISNLRNEKQVEYLPNFISNLYIDFPNNMRKKFSEVYYLLTDMNKNVFNSKLNVFKSSLCLGCFNYIKGETQYIQSEKGITIKNPFLFKFPCGCIFCSDKCLNRFLEHIPFEKKTLFICACGEEYNCLKLKYLLYFAVSHNLISFKKEILRILYDYMKNKCCICYIEVPLVQGKKNNFNIYEIKDEEIDQIFKINKFNHLVCNKCVKRDISKKKVFYCKMCSSEHYILGQKNINGQIKTDCNIF